MDKPTSGTVRLIKVGRTIQTRRGAGIAVIVPFIRLSGKWIERAGFLEGDIIEVTAAHGEIKMIRQGEQNAQSCAQGELF